MIGDEQQCPLSTTAITTTTSTTTTTIDEDKSLTLNGDNTVDDVDDDPESNASSLISEEYHQPFSVTTLDSDDFDSLGTTTSITIPIPAANGNESSICSNSNSNTSNNYGNPLAYSLHTIIEESCEESDADDYYAAKHLRQIKVNASSNNNNNINNNDSHTRSNHNTYGNNDDDDDDDDDVDVESHGQHNHNGHYGDEIYDGDAVFIQQYDNDVGVDDDDQIEGDYDDDDEVYFNDNHNGHHSPFHTSDSESLPTDSEQFNNYQIAHHVINQMGSMVDSESSVSSGHDDDDDYDNDDIGNGNDKESTFSPSSRLEKYFTIGLVSPDAYDYSENVDLQVKEKKKDVVIKEKKNISTTSIDVEEIKISLPQTGHRIEVKSPSSFDGDTLPPTPSPDYNVDVDKPKPTIENDHEIRGRTKIVVDDKIRIQIRSPDRPHQKRPAPQPPGPKPKWSPKTSQPDLIPSVGQASDHLNDWIRRQDFTSSEAVSVEIINSKDDDDYKNDEDDEERQANSSSPTTTIRSSASASTSSTFTPIASQIINPPVKMYSDVNRKNPRRPDRNFNSHNNNHSSNISSSSKIHDEMSKSGGLNCIGDELDFKMLLNRNQKTLSSPNEVNEIFMAGHKKEPKSCLRMKLKKSSLGSLLSSLKISNSPISSLFRSKR